MQKELGSMDVGSIIHKPFGERFRSVDFILKNPELAVFVKKIMAIPLLPCDLVHSTYSVLEIPATIR